MIHFSMPVPAGTGSPFPTPSTGHPGDVHACAHHLPRTTRLRANGVVCVVVVVILVVLQQNLGMEPLAALGLLLSAGWTTTALLPGLLGVGQPTPAVALSGHGTGGHGPSRTSPSTSARRARHRAATGTASRAARRITRG